MLFVTGGTGLVGSFLLQELRSRGLAVRALHRSPVPAAVAAMAPGTEWVAGDLLDTELLHQCLTPDVTHVFHCAGLVSYAPQDEDLLLTTNVLGTAAIVDACLARPGIRLGHVSSVAALGGPKARAGGGPAANETATADAAATEGATAAGATDNARAAAAATDGATAAAGEVTVVDETATWDLGAAHGAYATSKYLGELEVWRGVAEGLSAVVVNPAVVLGPGDWHRSSTRLLRYAAQGHRFYTPGLINVVDVRDVVAQLLALALERPDISGERFVLSAGALPLGEVLAQAAAGFGQRPPTVAVPAWAAEIIWRVEHVRAVLTGARPLITKATARAGRRPLRYDGRRAVAATGLPYRALPDTIAWAVAGLQPPPPAAP